MRLGVAFCLEKVGIGWCCKGVRNQGRGTVEEEGIDKFDFELMNNDEKMEALEDAELDSFNFDMY